MVDVIWPLRCIISIPFSWHMHIRACPSVPLHSQSKRYIIHISAEEKRMERACAGIPLLPMSRFPSQKSKGHAMDFGIHKEELSLRHLQKYQLVATFCGANGVAAPISDSNTVSVCVWERERERERERGWRESGRLFASLDESLRKATLQVEIPERAENASMKRN